MREYTPGPWFVVEGDEWTDNIATDTPEQGIWTVASANPRRAEFQANKRLIAAAPDMAEALKAVLEELLDQEKMPIMSNVYRKAQAAYHKATGEHAEAYKATAKGK